ncbi:hypothetical protein WA588_002106 [Blastocystis sp. NMH]
MSRFEISIKEQAVLLRVISDPSYVISFTDSSNNLKVSVVEAASSHFATDFLCDGLLGVYKLSGSIFLEVITSTSMIGSSFDGNPVYEVKAVEFVRVPGGKEEYVDTKYVQMLQDVLKVAHLYFSLHVDLTKRLQDSMCVGLTEEDHLFPTTMNPLFMFNYPTIQELAPFKEYFPRDLIPITIFGFMKIIPSLTAGSVSFTLTLISRRCIHRMGRRFNTRGADEDGYVANFVETEQIVKTASRQLFSHVQIRGSIPLAWTQTPTMKYTPRIHIEDDTKRLRTHFDMLRGRYGRVLVVNLIDRKKDQLLIGCEFERACLKYDPSQESVRFVWFDFHQECKNMRYDKLSKLAGMTEREVREGEYFAYDLSRGEVTKRQSLVIRTNCIDCLDRTNVVQSVYAKQLLCTELFGETPSAFDASRDLTQAFNNLWADNADEMSLLYASSRSLKTDFTRTGKRSTLGALQDGVNSVIRYVNNNFYDGYFEDCLNLTFDRVLIDEAADRLVLKRKKYTFDSFFAVVLLPAAAACFLASRVVSRVAGEEYASIAMDGLLVVSFSAIFYAFVKKGLAFGSTFVSRSILPVKKPFLVCW